MEKVSWMELILSEKQAGLPNSEGVDIHCRSFVIFGGYFSIIVVQILSYFKTV